MAVTPIHVYGKRRICYPLVSDLEYTIDDIVSDVEATYIKVSPENAKCYNTFFTYDDMERIKLFGGIYFRVSPKSDLTSVTIKDNDHTCTFDIKKIPEFYEFRNKLELMCSLRDV
jgi:hypothetical protein